MNGERVSGTLDGDGYYKLLRYYFIDLSVSIFLTRHFDKVSLFPSNQGPWKRLLSGSVMAAGTMAFCNLV